MLTQTLQRITTEQEPTPRLVRLPLPRKRRNATQAELRLLANLASTREAAEICNLTRWRIERAAQRGTIPVYGPTALVDLSDVEVLASMPSESEDRGVCILRMLQSNTTNEDAAKAYGVSVRTVQRIRSAAMFSRKAS